MYTFYQWKPVNKSAIHKTETAGRNNRNEMFDVQKRQTMHTDLKFSGLKC